MVFRRISAAPGYEFFGIGDTKRDLIEIKRAAISYRKADVTVSRKAHLVAVPTAALG